jgi:hypothetical protein
MNGFVLRSRPIVVAGPWPGWIVTSSGRLMSTSRSVRRSAAGLDVGKSERPTLPAKSVSPTIACRDSSWT